MPNLRLPGPTPVPPEVYQAMSKQMIDHRGVEFAELIERLTANLQRAFQTTNDLYVLSSSGTGSMEAAIVNTLSIGERVLGVTIGNFGDRFLKIASSYGASVNQLKFDEGEVADPDQIRQALKDDPEITAVLVTHNETSTGITNDLETIAGIVKDEFDKLLLVDAISSLGSIKLPVDEWGLDVVVAGSQKGWMCPPGLSMISFSERAWKAAETSTMPKFYFSMAEAKKSLASGQTPWTPALSLMFGLDYAVQQMLSQGDMQAVYDFHQDMAEYTRTGLKSMGIGLVAKDEKFASNTVTAAWVPEGITDEALLSCLRDEYDIIAAEGRGLLAGKVFRIGHMGYVSKEDINDVFLALKEALPKLGFAPSKVG
jgi:aspartate aminotransferase-like enzyme|tara:strand:+ start:3230 stop:4339 length:1110 start_codon:yes stop_codon:yes gene_type:complete